MNRCSGRARRLMRCATRSAPDAADGEQRGKQQGAKGQPLAIGMEFEQGGVDAARLRFLTEGSRGRAGTGAWLEQVVAAVIRTIRSLLPEAATVLEHVSV